MAGSRTAGWIREVVATAANITLGNNDVGKIITNRGATGAVTITLPTPSTDNAGGMIEVLSQANQDTIVNCATNDLLIITNDGAADSVALSTASQKIGGGFRFVSDGTNWWALYQGSNTGTQTVTPAT